MADDGPRRVTLERSATGVYRATNASGVELRFGSMDDEGFSPVELLLAALGGCAAVDLDVVTSRHVEPERFQVAVEAEKVRDDDGNILRDIRITFRVAFPEGDAGDRARARAPRAVQVSHDRNCTVSRTVEAGTPVEVRLDPHP